MTTIPEIRAQMDAEKGMDAFKGIIQCNDHRAALLTHLDAMAGALKWAMTKLPKPAERSTEATGPYDYCDRWNNAREVLKQAGYWE